jgi:hypothetical protein
MREEASDFSTGVRAKWFSEHRQHYSDWKEQHLALVEHPLSLNTLLRTARTMGSRLDRAPDHCSVSTPISPTRYLLLIQGIHTAEYMQSSALGALQAHGMILGHFRSVRDVYTASMACGLGGLQLVS